MTWDYAYTFFQFNALEIPIYYLFYRQQRRFTDCILLVTFGNLFTHPLVFFGFLGSGWSYLVSILIAEPFALLAEALLHSYGGGLSWRRTLLASTAANLFSWQVAPILTYVLFF